MTGSASDITRLPDLAHGQSRTGPIRNQRPVYVDLLPPCNAGCPAGKTVPTKDLALQAIAYADVYVARVAFGADPQQTLRAFREAEAYDGPSLIIAYSHCVAHGYDMREGLSQQYGAVASGHWPLIRYDPVAPADGDNPFPLDSPRPRMSLADYRKGELRFRALAAAQPAESERLLDLAQQVADQRWRLYEEMATRDASEFPSDPGRGD